MINILDNKEFLEFVRQSIQWRIENHKSLSDAAHRAFLDEEVDLVMEKELQKYQNWQDEFEKYLAYKYEFEKGLK